MSSAADLLARIEQAKSLHQSASNQLSAVNSYRSPINVAPINIGRAIFYTIEGINNGINDEIDGRRADTVTRGNERENERRGGDDNVDWAGYDILERYLAGGDDWTIDNDPRWTEYMKEAPGLEEHVRDRLNERAQELIQNVPEGQTVTVPFNDVSSAETDNGYSTGYQLLHGTNSEVGGYQIEGTATITNTGNGYTVRFDTSHTWNDKIDPNGDYREDIIYNAAVEAFTLGRADPYDIHVRWDAESTIQLDQNGTPIRAEGWPSG